MTTVGYGDYFATTGLGRVVGIGAAFTGVFLESLSVLCITLSLKHRFSQELSFKILDSLRKKRKLMKRAVKMIKSMFFYNRSKNRKHLLKYSNSLRLFGRTAKHLRIQLMQGVTQDEYNRNESKKLSNEITKS
jgi:hypothetical protein